MRTSRKATGLDLLTGRPERLLEVGDDGVLTGLVGPLRPRRIVVVVPRDDRHEVQHADEVQLRQGTNQHLLAAVQPIDVEAAVGRAFDKSCRQCLDLGDEVVARSKERLAVADGRQPAGGGQLRLEAAGQHRRYVVPEHRLGLGGDQLRRFEDSAGRGVARLELLHLLGRVLDEHVLEQLVEVAAACHGSLGGAAFVEDRHDRAVGFGLADRVLVDERAEDGVGALLALAHDRRAGETDLGGVWQRCHEVGVQRRGLRAVRFVDQDDDRLVGVEHAERLARVVAGQPGGSRGAGGVACRGTSGSWRRPAPGPSRPGRS